MKKRRKHSRCLNCTEPLERKFNYCPHCGQENTDNQVSISQLIGEFLSNFFSLDSRFGRTFKPFLFNPGKITNAFIAGKRIFYANPIRWYLVISLFHFFFMSKVMQPSVKEMKERGFLGQKVDLSASQIDSLYQLPDTTDLWPFSEPKQQILNHLIENTTLTDNEIYDSLHLKKQHQLDQYLSKKAIRISRETTASLNGYLLKQIPIIIFFILPVYALLLKLFFWRKGLYINHLIHSLHLHSFLFFISGWAWVLALFFNELENIAIPIISIVMFVYTVVSFRNVYGVQLIRSILRAFWIGFFYFIALVVVFVFGVLFSLALF